METFYEKISTIQTKIEEALKLIDHYDFCKCSANGGLELKTIVLVQYKKRVLEKLHTALEEIRSDTAVDADALIQNLTKILTENWKFVKGTMCCYSVLREDNVTSLLGNIALLLAEETNKSSQLSQDFSEK